MANTPIPNRWLLTDCWLFEVLPGSLPTILAGAQTQSSFPSVAPHQRVEGTAPRHGASRAPRSLLGASEEAEAPAQVPHKPRYYAAFSTRAL